MQTEVTGNIIRNLREKKGWTQKQLAERLAVSDKAVSKWETGKGLPDIALLETVAKVLEVSIAELMNGQQVNNKNRAGNLLKGHFYLCPNCGNVIYSAGEGVFSCCGNLLTPLEASAPPEEHGLTVEKIEQDYYLHLRHPMTREHHILFFAYVTGDRVQFLKTYPEQEPEARFYRYGHGRLFYCCNQEGLFFCRV